MFKKMLSVVLTAFVTLVLALTTVGCGRDYGEVYRGEQMVQFEGWCILQHTPQLEMYIATNLERHEGWVIPVKTSGVHLMSYEKFGFSDEPGNWSMGILNGHKVTVQAVFDHEHDAPEEGNTYQGAQDIYIWVTD